MVFYFAMNPLWMRLTFGFIDVDLACGVLSLLAYLRGLG